jgi:leucyl-tRNA synthetase
MSTYDFKSIEAKWQKEWADNLVYKTDINPSKPKFYALDMFPYPSGAGLHVGHPLGYIASDIVSRFKRLNGYNVLHPMGFDAFGLPAEQYAIQTGQHPAITTEQNLKRYKQQLNRIGFSYDWDREVQTCDPSYYKWTQWIFIQLFNSWYNAKSDKAESIDNLITIFENDGNVNVEHKGDNTPSFTAEDWENYSKTEKSRILQSYRLAFQKETTVNWCEELGTVLANDEVKDGKSERGGYDVTQKLMTQWYLRITAYADRLLSGLDTIQWSDSIKEMQRNWIGRSEGASIHFKVADSTSNIEVFTTRPDTIFGSTFMALAPDHELVTEITTKEQKEEVAAYATNANNKSERERMMNKEVSGVFTGGFALNPFNNAPIPIYISEYVLSGYGTGAIMAVPAHDERDHAFAKHFNLEIKQVISSPEGIDIQEQSYDAKDGILMNSENFDRLSVKEGIKATIQLAEERGFGTRMVNYKLRDAGYSRQRYWGEPFPIIYEDGVPTVDNNLPLELPKVESYEPTGTGESPLASNTEWLNTENGRRETDTMPGYAGSSWYFLRYMDPKNDEVFASKESLDYWQQVDLYIGGTEHATGHLLYSRFWTKFLNDLGYINFDEPFKKLVNQGMIQGESMLLKTGDRELHVPVSYATKDATLSVDQFAKLQEADNRFTDVDVATLDVQDGVIQLRTVVEKMSKSKFNVVNPDDVSDSYGADTLRLYEMFLGPLEDSKPWSTKGIDGTHRFLKKLWALFYNQDGKQVWNENEPSKDSLKTLHKTIKKITEDINNFSFNTSVSQFMICVNELGSQKCNSKAILEQVLILLNPFAPHITEELWNKLGNTSFVLDANWPMYDESLLVESTKAYPISINGKTRTTIEFPLDMSKEDIEVHVLENDIVQKWLDGNAPKKVIVVPGRIVNVVV